MVNNNKHTSKPSEVLTLKYWKFCLRATPTVTRANPFIIYNGHLIGPVTLTPNAECLVVALSLPVSTTHVCRGWDSNTQITACEANTLTDCATAAACTLEYKMFLNFKPVHQPSFKNSFKSLSNKSFGFNPRPQLFKSMRRLILLLMFQIVIAWDTAVIS